MAAITAIAVITPLPASAALIVSFSGIIDSDSVDSGAVGQTVTGSLSLDFSAPQFSGGSSSDAWESSYFYTPESCSVCTQQSNPPQISGQTSNGFHVGGGSSFDVGSRSIARNASSGGYNQYQIQAYSSFGNAGETVIRLNVYDILGVSTGIFTDPNGGLNFDQSINWFSSGAAPLLYESSFDASTGSSHTVYGHLTSVSLSSGTIPEPASIALVGIALLVGVKASRPKAASLRV